MKLPTASGLERAFECPPSQFLRVQASESSPYSDRGTVIAAFIRAVVGGQSRTDALSAIDNEEWRSTCERIDFARLVGDLSHVRGEMAYAVDVDAMLVRELGSNIGRHYPALGEFEYAGTSDLEGRRCDGIEVSIDVKSGQPVTPCHANRQVKFHCLARLLATDSSEVEGRIAYVAEDGGVSLDCYTFSRFQLECFADELRDQKDIAAAALAAYRANEGVRVNGGDWCKNCPAKVSCPLFVGLAREMTSDPALRSDSTQEEIAGVLSLMTPQRLGEAWILAKRKEEVLGMILKGIRSIASENAIPLPTGKVLEERTRMMPRFKKELALSLLRDLGATEEQLASLTVLTEEPYVQAFAAPRSGAKRPRVRLATILGAA